jgi:hypothetical protein
MAKILSVAILVVFLAALIADLNAVYVMNLNGYSVLVDKVIPDGSKTVNYVSRLLKTLSK